MTKILGMKGKMRFFHCGLECLFWEKNESVRRKKMIEMLLLNYFILMI